MFGCKFNGDAALAGDSMRQGYRDVRQPSRKMRAFSGISSLQAVQSTTKAAQNASHASA
jgi:hypothetical protein